MAYSSADSPSSLGTPLINTSSLTPTFSQSETASLDEAFLKCSTKANVEDADNSFKHYFKNSKLKNTGNCEQITIYCAGCHMPIRDQFYQSVNLQLWHQNCLKCIECGLPLSNKCYIKKNVFYCKQDFLKTFGPKCSGCHKSIQSDDLVQHIDNQTFHTSCFQCVLCARPLKKGDRCCSVCVNKGTETAAAVVICQKHFENAKHSMEQTEMFNQSSVHEDDAKSTWTDAFLWNNNHSTYTKKSDNFVMETDSCFKALPSNHLPLAHISPNLPYSNKHLLSTLGSKPLTSPSLQSLIAASSKISPPDFPTSLSSTSSNFHLTPLQHQIPMVETDNSKHLFASFNCSTNNMATKPDNYTDDLNDVGEEEEEEEEEEENDDDDDDNNADGREKDADDSVSINSSSRMMNFLDPSDHSSQMSDESLNPSSGGPFGFSQENGGPVSSRGSSGGPFGLANANAKRRGPRTTIKAKQLDTLKVAFNTTPKPTRHVRESLAQETGLSMRVIQVWFQNRRSKERRMRQISALGVRRSFYRNSRRLRGIKPGVTVNNMEMSNNSMYHDYMIENNLNMYSLINSSGSHENAEILANNNTSTSTDSACRDMFYPASDKQLKETNQHSKPVMPYLSQDIPLSLLHPNYIQSTPEQLVLCGPDYFPPDFSSHRPNFNTIQQPFGSSKPNMFGITDASEIIMNNANVYLNQDHDKPDYGLSTNDALMSAQPLKTFIFDSPVSHSMVAMETIAPIPSQQIPNSIYLLSKQIQYSKPPVI